MTELLSAGIVVDTTVNIQHVESLNDVVAQITRIRVRETVPDTILDRADDIEVVHLTPDDLMQRLKEGKARAEQAQRALDHYCSPDKYVWYRPARQRPAVLAPWTAHLAVSVTIGPATTLSDLSADA